VIVEQQFGPGAAQVPDEIIGEHGKKDVGADAVVGLQPTGLSRGEAMMDRPDLEIDGLDRAEGALHPRERLVGEDRGRGVEQVCGHIGARHVEAVQRRLAGDSPCYCE